MVRKDDPAIRLGKRLFPVAWTAALMDDNKHEDYEFYEVRGDLIEVSGDRGTICLENGLLLSVPLCCIRLIDTQKEPAENGQALS